MHNKVWVISRVVSSEAHLQANEGRHQAITEIDAVINSNTTSVLATLSSNVISIVTSYELESESETGDGIVEIGASLELAILKFRTFIT